MSTSRYNNSGAVGTGTIIDNMASRVKSWATINNPAVTLVVLGSLNTSSVTDNGVGNFTHNYTSVFADTSGARFVSNSASATINGWSQLLQAVIYVGSQGYANVYMNASTPTVFDPAMGYFSAYGALA